MRLIDHRIPTLKATAMKRRLKFDGFRRAETPIEPGELNIVIGLRVQPELLDRRPLQQSDVRPRVNQGNDF